MTALIMPKYFFNLILTFILINNIINEEISHILTKLDKFLFLMACS